MHNEKYEAAKKRIDKTQNNIEEILEVEHYLVNNPVYGYKYNYALDKMV